MARIAVLTSRFPFPLEKGDKLRIYNQLKGLSENNEVFLIALDENKVSPEQKYALRFCKETYVFRINKFESAINIFKTFFRKKIPLQVGLYYKKSVHLRIKELLNEIKPDAVHCHLIRMSEYVRDAKNYSRTIDYMDAFSLGMTRRAEISSMFLKPILYMERKRLSHYERSIFDEIEKKTIISTQDRDAINHPDKHKIEVVPNGVDFEIFYPKEHEKKFDLLFTGNMGYPPNVASAIYAITKILPLVHKTRPQTTLLIAGVDCPEKIKKLAGEKVFVIEKFNHIRDAFLQSRIMLAPMLISIGLQNKILQALAMKIPTVASSLANNAIGSLDQQEIMEANAPDEYAASCVKLLNDPQFYSFIQENGYDFVRKNFDWQTQNNKLEKILLA